MNVLQQQYRNVHVEHSEHTTPARQRNTLTGRGKGWVIGLLVTGMAATVFQSFIAANTRKIAARMIVEARGALEKVPALTDSEKARLRTWKNAEHVRKAEQLGAPEIKDRSTAQGLAENGILVGIETNSWFLVREMTHSVPYVVPSARHLLFRLGVRFQDALQRRGIPPYRFVITSATRTREDQKRLSRVNANAAARSSHTFGTTVDIHYREFRYAATSDSLPSGMAVSPDLLARLLSQEYRRLASEHSEALKAVLGRTLLEMQEEGQVMVIYERLQPVYHLTVSDEIAPPEPENTARQARWEGINDPL